MTGEGFRTFDRGGASGVALNRPSPGFYHACPMPSTDLATLSHDRLIERVGQGGMGEVWLELPEFGALFGRAS